ncbi:hypothetical protein JTB14_000514 [Gonioctena quinquepunctata]|nr:hypothetical protein JTB14_000514 [Gonioctena quinquepunctata]
MSTRNGPNVEKHQNRESLTTPGLSTIEFYGTTQVSYIERSIGSNESSKRPPTSRPITPLVNQALRSRTYGNP